MAKEQKKFEDFTSEDLTKLRGEIVLNSLYTHDYENSFGLKAHCVAEFFDGYVSYLEELAEEDGYTDWEDAFKMFKIYDTEDNLYGWYCCFDDLSWMQYEEQEDEFDEEFYNGLTTIYKEE
jgi:hypothetical protein